NKIYVFGEFDGFEPQPPIAYRKTAVAVFNLANGNYIEVKKFVGGAEIFDGGFASYQFSDGKMLFGGSVSYQASGGPQLTKVLKWNEDLTDVESSLDFDFYPTNILSYSKQGSKVLVGGNRTNRLFITRIYDGPLAVDEVGSNTSFNVYPNTTISEFKNKTVDVIKSVRINDELGKNLANYSEQDTYDVSKFSPGIYLIYIETDSKVGVK